MNDHAWTMQTFAQPASSYCPGPCYLISILVGCHDHAESITIESDSFSLAHAVLRDMEKS